MNKHMVAPLGEKVLILMCADILAKRGHEGNRGLVRLDVAPRYCCWDQLSREGRKGNDTPDVFVNLS